MNRTILRSAAIVAGLLVLAAVALPFLIDANTFRPQLEAALTSALGRDVKVGNLKLSLFSGGVSAGDLAIADDPAFSREPFVRAQAVSIGVELLPLVFSRKLNVTSVKIDAPQVALIQSPSGDWNFSSLGSKDAPRRVAPAPGAAPQKLDLSVKLMKISNGRFSLARTAGRSKPLTLEGVNAEVRNFSAARSFPFSFTAKVAGGGEIRLDGNAGPLNDEDLSRTPLLASLKVSQFDLAGSGWTQATPGMAGIVSLEGHVNSDGKIAGVGAQVKAEKLKLSAHGSPGEKPVDLDVRLAHDLHTRSGRIGQSSLRIGAAKASFSGTYAAQGESTALHVAMAGAEMPVAELASMLAPLGLALPAGASLQSGTATVKLAADGPTERLVTAGTIALNHTTLAGFDLGRKMQVVQALAGIRSGSNTVIQTLGGNFRMAPEGISADALQMVVDGIGEMAGAGTISPANALDFHMTAKLHAGGVLKAASDQAVPFMVGGTCSDPVFRPDVRSLVRDNAKSVGAKAAQGLLNRFLGGKK